MIIIAEIGVNHNGSFELAKELIEKAALAGADVVKFQTFKAEDNISKFAEMATYQKNNLQKESSQLEMVQKYELSNNEFVKLSKIANLNNISFLSTAFDLNALQFLDSLEMEYLKIASGEITNLPLLEEIGKRNKKVLLSTGMANTQEIDDAITIISSNGTPRDKITILQCTSQYPAPDKDINLNAMLDLGREFNLKYGLSDHSEGIIASLAAVTLGASVIEKHITLDKALPGPDHKASIDIKELNDLIFLARRIEIQMGSNVKKLTESEINTKQVARKSIVAANNIKEGDVITKNNILVKRPGIGISPMDFYKILGKVAKKDIEKDRVIFYEDIE